MSFGLARGLVKDRNALQRGVGAEADGSFAIGPEDETSEDFQAVYEEVSGMDLDGFFQIWLRDPVKPPATWTL